MSDFHRELFRRMREQNKTAHQFAATWSAITKWQHKKRKEPA